MGLFSSTKNYDRFPVIQEVEKIEKVHVEPLKVEPPKDDINERIALAEKLNLSRQVKVLKAERVGFQSFPFSSLCEKMGFTDVDTVSLGPPYKSQDFRWGHLNRRILLRMGLICHYGKPLKMSILDCLEQTQNLEIFDEFRIIAPDNHFTQTDYEARDPMLVGIITSSDLPDRMIFPILQWE